MADLASIRKCIEKLPSDGVKTVDTLSSAILRLFVRLDEIERLVKDHNRRLPAIGRGEDLDPIVSSEVPMTSLGMHRPRRPRRLRNLLERARRGG
jgi:hypothetical protein